MKQFFAFLLLSLPLAAQQGPPIDGRLAQWGALWQDKEVIGHYGITTQDDEQLEQEVYTLTLYDADLHAIGSRAYPARSSFSVKDVSYDGTHLAVLVYAEERASIDLLDGSANTIKTVPLQEPRINADGVVFATADGYLVAEEMHIVPRNPSSMVNARLEYVPREDARTGWVRRFGDPRARLQSTHAHILYRDEELLLVHALTVLNTSSKQESSSTFYAIDMATGEDLFQLRLSPDKEELAAAFYAAAPHGDAIRVVTHAADYGSSRDLYPGGTELITYDRQGNELERQPIDLRQGAADALAASHSRPLAAMAEFVLQSATFTPAGELSLLAASRVREKREVTFDRSFAYGFDASGKLTEVLPLLRTPLTVPAYFLGRGGAGLMGPKARHYQLAQQLSAHRGPFNHALSTGHGGTASHYLWEREFTPYAVNYRGLHAVSFRDGAFEKEFVPLEDTPIGWLFPARAGYVLLMQPDPDGNQLVPRLEKLSR